MGIQDRRQRERQQRINLILESAKKIFFEKGYSSTTIEEISAEAELSPATIYLYFKSKDDLFTALMVPGLEFVGRELDKIERKKNNSFAKDMDEIWNNVFIRYLEKHKSELLILLIFQQFGILNSISQEQVERINSLGRNNYNKLRKIIQKHIDSEQIIDLESKAIPDLVWGMFAAAVHITQSKTVTNKEKILEKNLSNYLEVLKRGLVKY